VGKGPFVDVDVGLEHGAPPIIPLPQAPRQGVGAGARTTRGGAVGGREGCRGPVGLSEGVPVPPDKAPVSLYSVRPACLGKAPLSIMSCPSPQGGNCSVPTVPMPTSIPVILVCVCVCAFVFVDIETGGNPGVTSKTDIPVQHPRTPPPPDGNEGSGRQPTGEILGAEGHAHRGPWATTGPQGLGVSVPGGGGGWSTCGHPQVDVIPGRLADHPVRKKTRRAYRPCRKNTNGKVPIAKTCSVGRGDYHPSVGIGHPPMGAGGVTGTGPPSVGGRRTRPPRGWGDDTRWSMRGLVHANTDPGRPSPIPRRPPPSLPPGRSSGAQMAEVGRWLPRGMEGPVPRWAPAGAKGMERVPSHHSGHRVEDGRKRGVDGCPLGGRIRGR